jgi:hypothetical protein
VSSVLGGFTKKIDAHNLAVVFLCKE